MSVYSYVVLKVHTNVRKLGTHLNVCFINRTYVRWKYTCLFSYNNKRSIYLYKMNICSSVGTRTLFRPALSLSFLYYTISIYRNENTLSRHITFPTTFFPHLCLPYISLLYIYSIYREYTLPQLFPPFLLPFIILLLYIEEEIFSPPLSPLIYILS